jgi:hypothetical protein
VTGGWRRLHNEELHNLYVSPDIIRRMRLTGQIARMGNMKNMYAILARKPERRTFYDVEVDGYWIILESICWSQ